MRKFASKSFRATLPHTLAASYRRKLNKYPFLLFGLPFISTIVAGSFFLTPATALRYERYDRKNRQMSQEESLGIGKNRRKVDMKEEYYVCASRNRSALKRFKESRWCLYRGFKQRTSRIGNSDEWNDSPARLTEYWSDTMDELHQLWI